jgi:hypothetical protein
MNSVEGLALSPALGKVEGEGRGTWHVGAMALRNFTEGQVLNRLAALLRPAEVVAVR